MSERERKGGTARAATFQRKDPARATKPQLTCDNASLGFIQVTGYHVPHAAWLAGSCRESPRLARDTKINGIFLNFFEAVGCCDPQLESLSAPLRRYTQGATEVTRDAVGKKEGRGSTGSGI